ncbi:MULTISPECIES: hypothetical protein [Dietzia]|uniref:Uncharacterized protein n=1 Tax=Dietzia natronolimnaea TaxID=161920 RepID=A0A2A2WMS0_9ACTN|nr:MULTISPECIES: hypothetical protein [Dietzia]AVZ38649.1 hypothetical protein CT688_03275 [Dietzia sp. JS16-p6b]PAY22482.1 hypothetical protein CEY15_13160 [Dietzia natronolimnaea]QGW23733.1 hypothetical protein GJR88_01064 [Dietzia sp. DQ12-45-1b]
MTPHRTAVRVAAALGATAALTLAGAGAASAATAANPVVNGNTVSVTFEKDFVVDADTCVAAVVPTSSAPALLTQLEALNNLDLTAINNLINSMADVTFLQTGGLVPSPIASVTIADVTVSATVPSNVYAVVSYCLLGGSDIGGPVLVGDPLDAIQGSLGGLSTEDTLGTLSSATGEGDASGLGSLLGLLGGGEGGGLGLDTLSAEG